MSITFKIKRGDATANNTYTGKQGELTMVTTAGTSEEAKQGRVVRFHDGETEGGFELARKDLANVQIPLGGMNFEYKWHDTAVVGAGATGHPTEQSIAATATQDSGNPPSFGTGEFKLHLDDTDSNGTVLSSFLDTIGTVSASILGTFRLYKKADSTEFILFSILDADKISGDSTASPPYSDYYRFTVKELVGNLDLTNDLDLMLSYVSSGEDAINAFVTREYVPMPASSLGTITDFADASTAIRVLIGSKVVPFTTDTSITPRYEIGTITQTADAGDGVLGISNTNTTEPFNDVPQRFIKIDNITGDNKDITDVVTLTIPIQITKANGDVITIDRLAIFDKNKVSTNVTLESDDYQIGYDPSGSTPDPSTYTITATPYGFAAAETVIDEIISTRQFSVTSAPSSTWAEGQKIYKDENNHAIIHTVVNTTTFKVSDLVGDFSAGDVITNGTAGATVNSSGLLSASDTSTEIKGRSTTHTVARNSPNTKFIRRRYSVKVYEGSTSDEVSSQDSLTVFGTQE